MEAGTTQQPSHRWRSHDHLNFRPSFAQQRRGLDRALSASNDHNRAAVKSREVPMLGRVRGQLARHCLKFARLMRITCDSRGYYHALGSNRFTVLRSQAKASAGSLDQLYATRINLRHGVLLKPSAVGDKAVQWNWTRQIQIGVNRKSIERTPAV